MMYFLKVKKKKWIVDDDLSEFFKKKNPKDILKKYKKK